MTQAATRPGRSNGDHRESHDSDGREEEIRACLDLRGIPKHMHNGIVGYIMRGESMGDFLISVFSNDLMGAAARADFHNQHALHAYAMFLFNDAPSLCHGSLELMDAWMDKGGLKGGAV